MLCPSVRKKSRVLKFYGILRTGHVKNPGDVMRVVVALIGVAAVVWAVLMGNFGFSPTDIGDRAEQVRPNFIDVLNVPKEEIAAVIAAANSAADHANTKGIEAATWAVRLKSLVIGLGGAIAVLSALKPMAGGTTILAVVIGLFGGISAWATNATSTIGQSQKTAEACVTSLESEIATTVAATATVTDETVFRQMLANLQRSADRCAGL